MIAFLLAIVAGFLTPYAETPLGRPAAGLLGEYMRLEDGELRLLTFMIMMLLAGVASALFVSGSTFWVILGGIIGYFATRPIAAIQSAMESRG